MWYVAFWSAEIETGRLYTRTILGEETHYFFAAVRFGIRPRSLAEDLDIRERLSVARRFAFEQQDAPVVEAQQRKILAAGGRRQPALLSVNAGPVRAQRALVAAER